VREGAVEHQSNHEDMRSPEHQICLSKEVIGKYVLRLWLADEFSESALAYSFQIEKPPLRFHFPVRGDWNGSGGFWSEFVTETVSLFPE
jgi:hypothetical protein